MEYGEKINKLKEILKNQKLALAFSGGADSSLLASILKEVSKETILITFDNGIFPYDFIENSKKQAENFNLKQYFVKDQFLQNPDLVKNNAKRCLYCREIMYRKIKEEASKHNMDIVADGNNISDFLYDRPGILAKYNHNIYSPLIEAELETEDVYRYLNENNIRYFKSTTCLATRIQTNTKLTSENITQVKNAERELEKIVENNVFKVRDIGGFGLVESENMDILLNTNTLQLIESKLKNIGFNKVAIQLSYTKNDSEKLFNPIEYKNENLTRDMVKLPYNIDIEKTKRQIEKVFSDIQILDNGNTLKINDNQIEIDIYNTGEILIDKREYKIEERIFIQILKLIRRSV